MDIFEFPIDLKNVISAFAYDCKWETVEKDLITCEEVQKMNMELHEGQHFLKDQMALMQDCTDYSTHAFPAAVVMPRFNSQ